ncbi:hypothetical protein SLA2020_210590 [Shorea laevis]
MVPWTLKYPFSSSIEIGIVHNSLAMVPFLVHARNSSHHRLPNPSLMQSTTNNQPQQTNPWPTANNCNLKRPSPIAVKTSPRVSPNDELFLFGSHNKSNPPFTFSRRQQSTYTVMFHYLLSPQPVPTLANLVVSQILTHHWLKLERKKDGKPW